MSRLDMGFCDHFYCNMRLGTKLLLPQNRDTLTHLFDTMRKEYPGMTMLRQRSKGEVSLEEDRKSNTYRWVSMEERRLSSGHFNPATYEDAVPLHTRLLGLAPHHLGISPIDVDYLDVQFGFDFDFVGNHDEVVADTFLAESPLACLTKIKGARAIDFQPTFTVALDAGCRTQARINVITQTNPGQVKDDDYTEEAISIYLIVRHYWGGGRLNDKLEKVWVELATQAHALTNEHIIPLIIMPLASAISSRS